MQRHFNCSDLEGAELEDQGVDGTALTHWEKRIFEVRMKGTVYSAVQKVMPARQMRLKILTDELKNAATSPTADL